MTELIEKNVIDIKKLENITRNGDGSYQAACPMCREEGHDSRGNHLRVYSNGAFHCVKYRRDKTHNAGILTIAGSCGTVETPKLTEPPPFAVLDRFFEDVIVKRLVRDFRYWNNRGISSETMEKYEGGVATEQEMKNRYVFPIRDRNNNIHGFTGRYILPIPKDERGKDKIERWKHLGKKENWVWDRENNLRAVANTGVAILVEGPGCALALREIGISGVFPIFGVVPSSKLVSTLITLNPKRIFVSTNNEPGNTKATLNGNEAAVRTQQMLSNFFSGNRVIERLPERKDFLDCSMEQRQKFKSEIYK